MAFASKISPAAAVLGLLSLGACATSPAGFAPQAGVQPAPGLVAAPPVQPYPAVAYSGYGAATPAPEPAIQFQPLSGAERPILDRPILERPILERHDGLLSSPPNDARPGDCYAKVVVPGQPIAAPPAQPRAVWVQSPPWPGQISPTWCIYYLPGAPQPVVMSPERYGWIRVVCDRDATPEKIRHVQRRLHDWGDYDGAYDGHYDDATAQGVVRFQEQRHIDHGGYLSMTTVEALETAPPPPPAPSFYASPIYQAQAPVPPEPAYPQTYAAPCCAAPVPAAAPPPPSIIVQRQVLVQRVVQPVYIQQPPVYAPPPPPQTVVQRVVQPVYIQQPPVYAPQPQFACGQPACAPQPYPCGPQSCANPGGQGYGGYGGGAYGGGYGQPGGAPPYRALLTWPGKSTY